MTAGKFSLVIPLKIVHSVYKLLLAGFLPRALVLVIIGRMQAMMNGNSQSLICQILLIY